MRRPARLALCTFLLVAAATAALASETGARPLRVGTKQVPPFAMRDANGAWTGISIELWTEFADRHGLAYEFVEMELPELLASLEDGSLDAVAAALTITGEREDLFDFSHPFLESGLTLAVRPDEGLRIRPVLDRFLEGDFVRRFALGLAALVLASVVVWMFERRKNPEQFGGGVVRGVASALWWSVVTMTTVGYGDMAPRTTAGRLLAVVWMIAGVILISALTAAITSALTVSQLAASAQHLEDLGDQPVVTVTGSTGEDFLRERGVRTLAVASLEECFDALREGRVAAVVYDQPVLRHFALSHPEEPLEVLPETLVRSGGYGIGLPPESPLREPLNRFLLRYVETGDWSAVVRRHLGR